MSSPSTVARGSTNHKTLLFPRAKLSYEPTRLFAAAPPKFLPRQSGRYSVQVRSPHEHLNIWTRLPVSESIMARISCNRAPHRHVLVEALGSSMTISALKTLKCCMASPRPNSFRFNYLYQKTIPAIQSAQKGRVTIKRDPKPSSRSD